MSSVIPRKLQSMASELDASANKTVMIDAAYKIERLEAEIERLRAAVKPFAERSLEDICTHHLLTAREALKQNSTE